MILASLFNFSQWFSTDYIGNTLGYFLAIISAFFMLTELYTIITQKTEPDLFMMLLAIFLAGLVQGLTADTLLAILTALCWLMIYSVWTIRESPVWRELMLASLISYLVIFAGRLIQVLLPIIFGTENISVWGLTGQQFFGIAWNSFIYVFFLLCIIFFGRRFFLVSRLTSPQIIYLLLFAVSYLILFKFSNVLEIYYPGVPKNVADRVLFASFGTYEIMIITNFLLYLISGPLLHLIFGVKKVTDERILRLVEEVKNKLNIKTKVRVGRVKAPILNAFAYGAFFDKRIAFMSDELDDFSDDDIRGIAGHELAHAQEAHTFWLFIITTFTFAITKAIQLPATALDYIFNPDVGTGFLWYYLYNIAILAFSYIFVRILEGRADLRTLKAGYGKPLAKSLVKLDGFYQGIASEMGLSVYLLTDKKQTPAEKIRFLGDAGRNMYNACVNPKRLDNFINLIASHPKSAYRVLALTSNEKLPPIKAAMLPYLLIIPFIRKKYIKELQSIRDNLTIVANETFSDIHGKEKVEVYDKLSHLTYRIEHLIGKEVVALPNIYSKKYQLGKISEIKTTNQIIHPISLKMETSDGEKELYLNDYDFKEFSIGQKQIFRNGKIGTITEIEDNGDTFQFHVKFNDGKEKKQKIPGIPVNYFENLIDKEILMNQKGLTKIAQLKNIKLNDSSIAESSLTISMGSQVKTISGDKFIYEFKPFEIYLKKSRLEQQISLLNSLENKHVSLQTKDDLDTLLKGIVGEVKEDSLKVVTFQEEREVPFDRIEFIYLYHDSIFLWYKPSASLVDRLIMRWQNRKKLTYIFS